MFYQCENYFYQEDTIFNTLAVKSSENENAYLDVTIIGGNKVIFSPSIIDPKDKDHKLMSEVDELVFKNDHPCFKALYDFAEEIASNEPQTINNEKPKMTSPNYLMCLRGQTQVKFVFVNALPERINEVVVEKNWAAKNATKNLMKDIRSLAAKTVGDEVSKSR